MTRKSEFGYITEDNVDDYIKSLIVSSKSQYINQNVAFNKRDQKQLALLRAVLLESASFGGLVKQILAARYSSNQQPSVNANALLYVPVEQPTRTDVSELPTAAEEIKDRARVKVQGNPGKSMGGFLK